MAVKGADASRLTLANLAISRYERLGGDNIDAAIAFAEESPYPEPDQIMVGVYTSGSN